MQELKLRDNVSVEVPVVYHLTIEIYSKVLIRVVMHLDRYEELPVHHNVKVVAITEGMDFVVNLEVGREEVKDLQN